MEGGKLRAILKKSFLNANGREWTKWTEWTEWIEWIEWAEWV
jgi:hypothetical protein